MQTARVVRTTNIAVVGLLALGLKGFSPAAVAAEARAGSALWTARADPSPSVLDQYWTNTRLASPDRLPDTAAFSEDRCHFIVECPARVREVGARCVENLRRFKTDCRNYFSWHSMGGLLAGAGMGSVLANTCLDREYQEWYQDDVRSAGLDDFSSFWRGFGEGQIVIPAVAGVAVLSAICYDCPLGDATNVYCSRALRAYAVGAPPMLLMQYALGASRPGETVYHSRWKPFDDNNGVSGHAFVGAVPFITAAMATDDRLLKGGFYFCSTLTAWSRVNDDAHYLSQACLGWLMAYLACEAVHGSERECRGWAIVPAGSAEMMGLGVIIRH